MASCARISTEGRALFVLTQGSGMSTGIEDPRGSISHPDTLSGLTIDAGSSHWTINGRHLESFHSGDRSYSTPTIVPVNLLSGVSSPSNLILNLMPTVNPLFKDSRYLLRPMINWLILGL
uniref:Uncharacterized protein n=1 Tax=Opuntia streptacantha TaxID=393608 RepID=A0A7C8YEB2_OPUST